MRTAVRAGAHYETSSAFDLRIAHSLWRSGVLPSERFIFCNGSKEPAYTNAILDLRRAGFTNVVPILDDPAEFEALADCTEPLLLGVRERKDPGDLAEGATYGYDRFGMLPEELDALAQRVAQTPHTIILYHADGRQPARGRRLLAEGDPRVARRLCAAAGAGAGACVLQLWRRHAHGRL